MRRTARRGRHSHHIIVPCQSSRIRDLLRVAHEEVSI
jgi:hypothetical protein